MTLLFRFRDVLIPSPLPGEQACFLDLVVSVPSILYTETNVWQAGK